MKRTIALAVIDEQRPITRGDCVHGPRPCPWVSCKFNLHELDIQGKDRDRIVIGDHALEPNATEREIDRAVETLVHRLQLRESCALDIADREPDGATLETVGGVLGVTRERIRQLEKKALNRMPRRLVRQLGIEPGDLHEPTAPDRMRAFRRPSR